MSSSITFTERELTVARLVLGGYKAVDPAGITTADWEKIASDAGINNGNVGRNAKFAFTTLLNKIKGDKGGKALKRNDDGEDEKAETAPAPKKVKRGTAKATKGKGGAKSKPKVEEEFDEDAADALEGAPQ